MALPQRPVKGQLPDDPFEAAAVVLGPSVPHALTALGEAPFTTWQFILQLRRSRGGEPAYQHALAMLEQGQNWQRQLAEHSLHGIIIPALLRAAPGVAWLGFAYNQPVTEQGPEVPAWWQWSPS